MQNRSRITIITGHFGSGKTEISINLALKQKDNYEKVALTDLDVINPYFRSREVSLLLEEKGIELIAPKGQLATADLPIVSGEIHRVLHDLRYQLVIDVGGDKDGATTLGQYYNEIKDQDYQMIFVVNTNRPYVSTVEGIRETIQNIEKATRLKVTGLINNTNLGMETTMEHILAGYEITREASAQLNVPFLYTTISQHVMADMVRESLGKEHLVITIDRFMRLPWEMD
ncbi:ATP-binding protein [Tepidibacillus fermentans]|uniref:CobQ/CobB/MinD/ParA family nucleotide binding protein n=1 Tax=Tepidibacillus fermentans TaxID=1281767 RepID=A0A4R3KM96_9BACI|nr:ATP-binding protein [Tepidibacillus fermentans]TCS84058.1 hypothetical protein EDD72_10299 [Tepidibacillus fermentans]